ncbi:FtsH protease activity modulator HflK [Halotalea alkalilenta]|uniref:FtsH protease activity modulator HflK n=1 Tax=Halotalea alkalilenta TaxID=376489 RepID=UPI000483303D|nr:FtsH protease activity modulator HflK [Halotalea alkalilenta]
MAWNEPGNGGNDKRHDPWGSGNRKDEGSDQGGRDDDKRPNDPWGGGNRGGKGSGRPPDLDEALKKLQNGLAGLFGGKKRSNGGGDGGSGGRKHSALILPAVLVVVALGVWAGSGFYLVDQSERGVVLRFGKYHDTVNPGLHWNPPLVDRVSLVNVTEVRSFQQNSSMLTSDTNIVTVRISVQYQVANPRDFVLNVREPEQSLRNALDSTLRHVVGASGMQNVLTSTSEVQEVQQADDTSPSQVEDESANPDAVPLISMTPPVQDSLLSGREELGPAVAERLQQALDAYRVGLRLQTVNLESTQAPDQVQDAVDDVIRSREDRQRSINEARAYENALQPQTEGEAQRLIEEATGYRNSVVSDARGQTSRFLAVLGEYRQAPEVTRERLYLDALSSIYARSPKALVDLDQNNNSMIYLPLDQLRGRGQDGQGAQVDPDEVRRLESVSRQTVDQVINRPGRTEAQSGSNTSGLREGRQ